MLCFTNKTATAIRTGISSPSRSTTPEYYRLIQGPLQQVHEATVPPHVWETVEEVRRGSKAGDFRGISVTKLCKLLGINKSNASRRALESKEMGYLKNLEIKTGRPAKYVIDNPLPSNLDILPSPEELKAYWRKNKSGNGDQ